MSVYIIAEAGCEHEGKLENAKQMVQIAASAGCNAIKFQHFNRLEIENNTQKGKDLWTKIEHCYLTPCKLKELQKLAQYCGIDMFCSAFGIQSVIALYNMGFRTIKIPSPCNENVRLIEYAVKKFDRVFISEGLVEAWLESPIDENVKWLHCTTGYPCPDNAVNLNLLKYGIIDGTYDGLSDHTVGHEAAVMAVAFGAKYIEKHFTLDKMNGGPDSHMALSPTELVDFVHQIRRAELMMGDGIKKIEGCEKPYLWRKSNG